MLSWPNGWPTAMTPTPWPSLHTRPAPTSSKAAPLMQRGGIARFATYAERYDRLAEMAATAERAEAALRSGRHREGAHREGG